MRRREQPGLQITTKRDTREGNASDTMHAFSGIVGCQCGEGSHVDTLDGATRFRLLRNCRTYEGAIVRQVGPKMICFSRRCLRASSQPLAAGFVERAYAAGPFRYPHACNVRCHRLKTKGILPRSEFTLLVTPGAYNRCV